MYFWVVYGNWLSQHLHVKEFEYSKVYELQMDLKTFKHIEISFFY